jgi:thioredoxin 2
MSFSVTRKCPQCSKENRVPARHLADTGRCGFCKAPLPPNDAPIEAGSEAFSDITRESPVPVLVDFWAPWCGPCKMTAPEVDAVAKEVAGKAVVLKVNTDQNPDLAARFRIQAIPTFLVMQGGNVAYQRAGAATRKEMRTWLGGATPAMPAS